MNFKKFQLVIMFFLMIAVAVFVVVLQTASAEDFTSTNFKLRNPVTDIFGGRSSSTNFEQFNAGGQTVTGESTSTNFKVQAGFLYFDPVGASTVSAPATASLASKIVSLSAQTATGAIDPVEAQSDLGGWSVTLSTTHFTSISAIQTLVGANSITTGGTYDGTYGISDPVKKYGVKIALGGGVGTATYQWRVDEGIWSSPAVSAATVTLEKGIQINFSGTYTTGDEWQFSVDTHSYTGLTVTPGDFTIISGSGTNVFKGSPETLTGAGAVSDAKTLLFSDTGFGIGTYQQPENLQLNIRANSLDGSFQGTATITIL